MRFTLGRGRNLSAGIEWKREWVDEQSWKRVSEGRDMEFHSGRVDVALWASG
jgi:hypothetical protein